MSGKGSARMRYLLISYPLHPCLTGDPPLGDQVLDAHGGVPAKAAFSHATWAGENGAGIAIRTVE